MPRPVDDPVCPPRIYRFDSFYSRAVYAPTSYDERLGAFFDRIRIKYGFSPTAERTPPSPPAPRPRTQLSLGLG